MGETVTPAQTGTEAAAPAVSALPALFEDEILDLLKFRLNRRVEDTSLDDYLRARINAAAAELQRIGIRLRATPEDKLLVVDYTAWTYQNRDKGEAMPDWLRLKRRERWLQEKREDKA